MTNMFRVKEVRMPWQLTDDALEEQVKLLTQQKVDTAKVAPPPDAAYDFADRIQQDYLSQPQPQISVAPAQRLSPLAVQEEQVQQRGTSLAGAFTGALTGPQAAGELVGRLGAPLPGDDALAGQFGTLSPEESAIATAERIEAAEKAEAAARADQEARAKLRSMPAGEGSPVDPLTGLPITGVVTDLTGKPYAGSETADLEAAGQAVLEERAATAEAGKDVALAKKEPVTQKWWLNAAQTAARSAAQMGTSALKAGPIVWEGIRDFYNADQLVGEGRSTTRAWIDTVDKALETMLPGDKAQSRDFITGLAGGAGSFAGFMMAGWIGATMGLPAGVTTGALGASTGGTQLFEEAEQFGATGLQKYMSFIAGMGLGVLEAVPVDRMFMRADVGTGGLVRRMLNNTVATSGEEFIQELSQAIGEDVVAKYLVGFDPDREIDPVEWFKQGLIGAITGAAGGTVTTAGTLAGISGGTTVPADEQQRLVDAAISRMEDELNQLPGIGDVAENLPPEGGADLATEAVEGLIAPEPPTRLFHGTEETFEQFDTSRAGTRDPGFFGTGTYFTADREDAESYGENVVEAEVQLQNPFEWDVSTPEAAERTRQALAGFGIQRGEIGAQDTGNLANADERRKFNAAVRAAGHDGVIVRTPFRETAEVVVFDPAAAARIVAPEAKRTGEPVVARGGTMPAVREDGRIELTHWTTAPRATLSPAQMGTGPLRGQERQRLFGPDAVPRTYYGVDARASMTVKERRKIPFDQQRRMGYVREAGIGEIRHTVSIEPDKLYNWFEDPLGLKAGLDRELAPSEQVTQYERIIRDAGFSGYYIEEGPQGQTVALFEEAVPERIIDERTGEELSAPSEEFEAKRTAAPQPTAEELAAQIPGLKGVLKYLTPAEKKKVTKRNAARLVTIFEEMPDAREMAAVAVSGRAKRGWYANSARALVEIFGAEDAPRFAALLAALSPQTSVESNAVNALNTWVNWDKAGRPAGRDEIVRIMGQSVQGGLGAGSVLPAWVNNSVRALISPDPTAITLSGPKVDSFMRNLWGVTVEVTNDAWMANFANLDQKLLAGQFRTAAPEEGGKFFAEKSTGYIAMSAAVRAAADSASKLTGETWTAAEVQETVWSWAKTLHDSAYGFGFAMAGKRDAILEMLNAGGLTAEALRSTPDFATLFTSGVYRNLLEKGGYDVEAIASGRRADETSGDASPLQLPEGTQASQEAFERHLRRAARRLDKLRARREQEALEAEQAATGRTAAVDEDGLPQATGEVVDDVPFFEESRVESAEFAGFFDEYEATVVREDVDLNKLPGSAGPIESVVRAARAYASSIGLPVRRQKEYVKADPDRGARIAAAYEAMPHAPADPEVAAAYQAMIDETLAQYQFVKASGLKVEAIEQGQEDPYPEGPKQVIDDLRDGHLWFFPTDQGFGTLTEIGDNPLLQPTGEFIGDRELLANDVFRVVHDFFGHGMEGSGFGARGEENAWQSHMRLYTPAALPAVTSETRGQNSWVNFGPFGEQNRANQRETVYADQKTGLMPEWTWTEGVADDTEFEAIFAGTDAGTITGIDDDALQLAQRMESEGRPMRDIWMATGWFKGVDGRWRFEISDADADFTPAAMQAMEPGETQLGSWPLEQVLKHDKLFAAYPALRGVTVTVRISNQYTDETGIFNENDMSIEVNGPNEEALIDVLLHEVQHAVQATEGFSRGGNVMMGEIYEGPNVEQARADYEKVLTDRTSTFDEMLSALERMRQAAAFEYYHRIAGEVEARNAAERGMHARAFRQFGEQSAQREPEFAGFPEDTADVPVDKQIVIMRTPVSMALSIMEPEAAVGQPQGTAGARAPFKAEPTRPVQGVPTTPGAAEEGTDASLAKISTGFINLLNLTARQGRLTLKGSDVMGQYSKLQRTVRLRTWNDLSTLVHEGGHALHDMMAGPLRSFVNRNEAEITQAATDLYGGDTNTMPKATHIREGFAEFFRVYTLNRAYAERKYPTLHDEFKTLLERENPTLERGLQLVQQQFTAYLQAPSVQVLRSMVVPGRRDVGINAAIQELREVGFKSWMAEFARQTLEASVNRFAGLNSLVSEMLSIGERNTKAAIDLTRAKDPRTLARLAPNFGQRAIVQMTDGIMPYQSTEPASASLREAILLSQGLPANANPRQLDQQRLDDFDTYLVALRALDEYRRFKEGKIERPPVGASLGDVVVAAKELRDKYGDGFNDAAMKVHDFGMAMWKKQYDAGLMTRETYREGLDRQFYVPLQRDMSDKQARFPGSALTGAKSLVKRFRGSDRQIVSPTSVLMHKLFSLEKAIAENDVKRALAQLADRVGTAGALVERIPATQMIGQNFSVRDIARQLTKDDSISEADAVDLLTILSGSIKDGNTMAMFRSEQVTEAGENILFFFDAGKIQAIQLKDGDLGADIVNLVNGLGRENLGFGMELIAGTSQVYRTAITSWPDFLIVNFIRDQFSAWVLNNVGFRPFATGIRGMLDEVRQRSWARKYNASMGIMGGMNVAALHKARLERDVQSLKNKGYVHKAFGDPGFMGAVAGFGRLIELSETGTRLGLFRKAYERGIADGLTDHEASVEAAYIATDYIDFGLNGNRMLMARRIVPFLNAQIQGFYKMVRTLGADEVRQRKGLKFALKAYFKSTKNMELSRVEKLAIRTGRAAWIKMSVLGMLSAALHFTFEDDEDYQEVGEYMRVTNWVIPLGDGRIISIPKPFELAMIANAVERGLEHAAGDETAKNKFLRGVALSMTPPVAPPAIQSLVEYAANKDFFTGQEIVPSYMQALSPELQYNNYTSEIAKEIGQITGWSPMVVEHFMSGLGASAYRDMTTITNALDPNRPTLDSTDAPIARRFVRDVRRGSQTSADFWAQASMLNGKLRTAEVTYKEFLEQGNEPAANRFLSSLSDDEQAYALLATHFKADSKRLNPFYRGRQISTIVSGMRREIVTELGLEDTDKFTDTGKIRLTAKRKAQVDELLSEIARREMRNTLVATGAPGWAGKKPMRVEETMALLEETSPRAYEELVRRLDKAKVYDGLAVFEGWPETRDRLLQDREDAFLNDMISGAKAFR